MAAASARVVIINKLGLHARSAMAFISIASRFESEVAVVRTDNAQRADGKSTLSLLQLVLAPGTEIEIRANGHDAQAAVDELVQLVRARFGEEV